MKRCLNCMEEYQDNLVSCPLCGYDGGQQDTPICVLKAGMVLQGRYIVGNCQSMRTCDITYMGWDALFERKVLLQEFYPFEYVTRENETDVVVKEGYDGLYAEGLRHFIQYHRSLIRLYQEDDIVEVYSCFIANGTAYATTQYSAAETLGDWLEKNSGGDLVWNSMVLVRRAIMALKKVHAMGLIHGAVDFDSFWVTGGEGLVLKGFAGPLYYMEKLEKNCDGQEDLWVDIYGLALMAGRMLAGQMDMRPQRLSKWLKQNQEGHPARIVNALEECLESNGSWNIKTLDEFCTAIFSEEETIRLGSKAVEGTEPEGTSVRRMRRERLRKKRRRRLGFAVFLGIAVLTGCFLMYGKWAHRRSVEQVIETAEKRNAETASSTAQGTTASALLEGEGVKGNKENGGENQ